MHVWYARANDDLRHSFHGLSAVLYLLFAYMLVVAVIPMLTEKLIVVDEVMHSQPWSIVKASVAEMM